MLELPLRLPSGLTLPNRLAKASMTEAIADDSGAPTPAHARLYGRWGRGGIGMQLTGNVMVDGRYLERPRNVTLDALEGEAGPAAVDALRAWAKSARTSGAPILMQISHPGRQTQKMVSREPVAPSAVAAVKLLGSFGKPRALREDEIVEIVERFARLAAIAQRAGFDGVQIHAAHGYLINQFLSPLTNLRTDSWGGSLAGRARFLLEVVRAVRARVGRSFTVSVKLNSADFQRGGFVEDDALEVVRMLDAEGVDLLEISGGSYETPAMFTPEGRGRGTDLRPSAYTPDGREAGTTTLAKAPSTIAREAYFLAFARRVRAVAKLPLMVTGGFRTRAAMEAALAEGALDLVGLARPLAIEPDLPQRLLDGTTERAATLAPFRLTIRALSVVAEGAWFGRQLWRMGRGLEPDPRLGVYRAIVVFFFGELLHALLRRTPTRSPALVEATP